jgi:hypothetical protein
LGASVRHFCSSACTPASVEPGPLRCRMQEAEAGLPDMGVGQSGSGVGAEVLLAHASRSDKSAMPLGRPAVGTQSARVAISGKLSCKPR